MHLLQLQLVCDNILGGREEELEKGWVGSMEEGGGRGSRDGGRGEVGGGRWEMKTTLLTNTFSKWCTFRSCELTSLLLLHSVLVFDYRGATSRSVCAWIWILAYPKLIPNEDCTLYHASRASAHLECYTMNGSFQLNNCIDICTALCSESYSFDQQFCSYIVQIFNIVPPLATCVCACIYVCERENTWRSYYHVPSCTLSQNAYKYLITHMF